MTDEQKEIFERLNAKTMLTGKGCWFFCGAPSGDGHCQIKVNGKAEYVHRLSAWIFKNYDMNSDLQVNHIRLGC